MKVKKTNVKDDYARSIFKKSISLIEVEDIAAFIKAKEDSLGTQPYTFLGKAKHKKHSGNKPISVIWELEKPIPAKFIKKTSKMLAM